MRVHHAIPIWSKEESNPLCRPLEGDGPEEEYGDQKVREHRRHVCRLFHNNRYAAVCICHNRFSFCAFNRAHANIRYNVN